MKNDMQHPDLNLLQQYADECLDAAQRRDITRHLESCAHCRTALRLETSLSAVLREVPLQNPTPHFDHAVLSAVAQSSKAASSPRIPVLKYAAVAALIIVTLGIVVVAGASGEEQSRSVLTPVFEKVTSLLSPVVHIMSKQTEQLAPQLDDQGHDFFRIFFLALAALLLIGGLERFISPPVRHGQRH